MKMKKKKKKKKSTLRDGACLRTDLHAVLVELDLEVLDAELAHQPLGLRLRVDGPDVVAERALEELDPDVADGLLLDLRFARGRLPTPAVVVRAPVRPVAFRVLARPRRQEVPARLALILVPFNPKPN